MPAAKYTEPVRLSQRWPADLLRAVEAAAAERGWNATQWLQEAAKAELRRQKRRAE
jgi:hypothetical protein